MLRSNSGGGSNGGGAAAAADRSTTTQAEKSVGDHPPVAEEHNMDDDMYDDDGDGGDDDGGGKGRSKSRRELPSGAVSTLKAWLLSPEHFTHPYPTPQDQAMLMQTTGIDKKQLKNWFTNARRRIWKPMLKKQIESGKISAIPSTAGSGFPGMQVVVNGAVVSSTSNSSNSAGAASMDNPHSVQAARVHYQQAMQDQNAQQQQQSTVRKQEALYCSSSLSIYDTSAHPKRSTEFFSSFRCSNIFAFDVNGVYYDRLHHSRYSTTMGTTTYIPIRHPRRRHRYCQVPTTTTTARTICNRICSRVRPSVRSRSYRRARSSARRIATPCSWSSLPGTRTWCDRLPSRRA